MGVDSDTVMHECQHLVGLCIARWRLEGRHAAEKTLVSGGLSPARILILDPDSMHWDSRIFLVTHAFPAWAALPSLYRKAFRQTGFLTPARKEFSDDVQTVNAMLNLAGRGPEILSFVTSTCELAEAITLELDGEFSLGAVEDLLITERPRELATLIPFAAVEDLIGERWRQAA